MSEQDQDYELFGEQWKKEMSNFKKNELIDMLAKALKEKKDISARSAEFMGKLETLVLTEDAGTDKVGEFVLDYFNLWQ